MLENHPDRPNKSTEVGIVEVRKNLKEDARSFAVDVDKKFPSFITA
jgi:hypothetical protein